MKNSNPKPPLSPLMAALARIPSGGIYAISPARAGINIHAINVLCDAGLVIWRGRRRPNGQSAFWSRTVAGDHALTEALHGRSFDLRLPI